MYLYLYTPYVQASDRCAHMTEHMIMHQLLADQQRFFQLYGMIDAKVDRRGVRVYVPDGIIDPVELRKLCTICHIYTHILQQEQHALKQELTQDIPTTGDLLSRIGGKYLVSPKFALYQYKRIAPQLLSDYMTTYTSPAYMSQYADDGGLIFLGEKMKRRVLPKSFPLVSWEKKQRTVNDIPFTLRFTSTTHPKAIIMMLFVEYFLDLLGMRQHRVQQGNYYFPLGHSDCFPSGLMLARQRNVYKFDESDFALAKQSFVQAANQSSHVRAQLQGASVLYHYDMLAYVHTTITSLSWQEIRALLNA